VSEPNDKTVLVTGAGGFIGSHLVEHLLEAGYRVRALVRYTSHGGTGNLSEVVARLAAEHAGTPLPDLGANALAHGPLEVVWGDVTDPAQMLRVCAGVHGICHLAALIGIPYSYVAPGSYVDVNVRGTLHLLEAARAQGVRRLVHTSTSEVYGTARYTPIDLAHPLQAQSPYAATKIGADKLVESYARSFDLDAVVLRPFNTFGPRQSFRAVIPTIIGQALRGAAITLGNLDAVRDFTFVLDTCAGFRRALEAELPRPTTVHLGTGVAVTIRELVATVGRVLGRELLVTHDASRVRPEASEVDVLLSDPSCAADWLDWRPAVSLEEGLRRTVEHMRARGVTGGDRYHV
jgi:nucleoside-diphosphate-sugar epimerase